MPYPFPFPDGSGDLPDPYRFASEGGGLVLYKGEIAIASQSEDGSWFSQSVTTSTGSFHLGDMHSNGSAGENVVWVNNLDKIAYFPPWQGVTTDGATVISPTVRTFGALTTAEPAGAVGSKIVNYQDTFTATGNLAFFKIDLMPAENFAGELVWRSVNGNGVEIASFIQAVNMVAGTLFSLTFNYPLFAKTGQQFTVSAQKGVGGELLKVRAGASVDTSPYRKTYSRSFADSAIPSTGATVGDVKDSFKTADHDGWIFLDGRAKSSLTASQQTAATSLGFGANLPDARNRFRIGAGGAHALNSVGGNSFIARANLPNVTVVGTTNTNNTGHTHAVDPPVATTSNGTAHNHGAGTLSAAASGSQHQHSIPNVGQASGTFRYDGTGSSSNSAPWAVNSNLTTGTDGTHSHSITGTTADGSAHTHTVDIASFTSGAESASHTHNFEFNLNGNTAQTGYMPNYLAVNAFVYLGA